VRPEETDRLDQLKITGSRYRELFLALLSDASIDDEPSVIASALRTSLIPARDELSSELESLVMRRKEALDASRTSARTTRARWMSAFVAVAVAGVALSAVLLRLMISRRRAYLPIPGRDARYEAGAPDSRRPSGTSRRWKTRPSHRPVA
jgi:hypothetical protein